MTGGPEKVPTLEGLRQVLSTARLVEGPAAATLALCILTLGLPWEMTAITLADVNWADGSVEVPQRGGHRRRIPLNDPALALIGGLAGFRSEGQVVTGCRGARYEARMFRADRLRRLLAVVDARAGGIEWSAHGIRRAGATALVSAGCAQDEVEALLGLRRSMTRDAYGRDGTRAADVWANLLS